MILYHYGYIIMKRIVAAGVALFMIATIFSGSGSVAMVESGNVDATTIGMNSNASFIAPMPVNISFHSFMLPHEIWMGSPRFMAIMKQ